MEGSVIYTETRRIHDEGEAKGIILGSIQTMLEDGKSKNEIFACVSKRHNLDKEKFDELFQDATGIDC